MLVTTSLTSCSICCIILSVYFPQFFVVDVDDLMRCWFILTLTSTTAAFAILIDSFMDAAGKCQAAARAADGRRGLEGFGCGCGAVERLNHGLVGTGHIDLQGPAAVADQGLYLHDKKRETSYCNILILQRSHVPE